MNKLFFTTLAFLAFNQIDAVQIGDSCTTPEGREGAVVIVGAGGVRRPSRSIQEAGDQLVCQSCQADGYWGTPQPDGTGYRCELTTAEKVRKNITPLISLYPSAVKIILEGKSEPHFQEASKLPGFAENPQLQENPGKDFTKIFSRFQAAHNTLRSKFPDLEPQIFTELQKLRDRFCSEAAQICMSHDTVAAGGSKIVNNQVIRANRDLYAEWCPLNTQVAINQISQCQKAIAGLPKVTAAEIKANSNCADLNIGCVKQVTFSVDNQTDLDITPVISLEAPINKAIDIATLVDIGALPHALKDAGKSSYAITSVPKKSLSQDITSVSGGKIAPTIFPVLYPNSKLTIAPITGYRIFADQPIQDNVTYTVTARGKDIYLNPAQQKIVTDQPKTVTPTTTPVSPPASAVPVIPATPVGKLTQAIFSGGAQDILKTMPGAQSCLIEQGNTKSYDAGDNSFANAIWRAFNLINSCPIFQK